jgi:hypothetical protein
VRQRELGGRRLLVGAKDNIYSGRGEQIRKFVLAKRRISQSELAADPLSQRVV